MQINTSPKTDRLIWLFVSVLLALMVGVPATVGFVAGLVDPGLELVGPFEALVMAAIGFFPFLINAADVWQHRRLASKPEREELLFKWESKKSDIINTFLGSLLLAGLIWLAPKLSERFGETKERWRANDCEDLMGKVIVYNQCERSRGCTLSLKDFQEREELVSEIGRKCQEK